jgi:hypothetical protein
MPCPRFIEFRSFHMLTAIDLDDQLFTPADEICDKGADWLLSDKFLPIGATVTQAAPQSSLRFGRIAP